MTERVPAWAAGHPWWTFLILFAVLAGVAAGAVMWGHEVDTAEVLVPRGLPEEATRREVAANFGPQELAFVMVRHASDAERLAPATVGKLATLAERLEAEEEILEVTSLASVLEQHAGRSLRGMSGTELRQLLQEVQLEAPALLAPVTAGRFNVLILHVDPDATDGEIVAAIEGVLAAPGAWNPQQLSATGAAFLAESAREGREVEPVLVAIAVAVAALFLILLFGRFSDALMPVFAALVATALAYAALPFLRVAYSPLLFTIAPLLFGISLVYPLHFVTSWRASQRRGLDAPEAAGEAGALSGRGVAVAALAAAVGFGCFLAAPVPQVRHWGALLLLATAGSLGLSLTLLPALLRLTPRPSAKAPAHAPWLERLLQWWADLSTRHWPPVVTLMLFLTVGAGIFAVGVEVEPTVGESRASGAAFRAAREYDTSFGGQATLEILVEGDPVADLAAMDVLAMRLRGASEVAFVDGPGNRARAAHDGILPDATNYTTFLERPAGDTLVSGTLSLVRVRYDGDETSEVLEDAREIAADEGLDARFTGRELIEQRSQEQAVESTLLFTALGLVLALGVIAAALQSYRATITAFLPLLIVLVWQLGFLGALSLPLNPVTGLTLAMVIGVGVDFSYTMARHSRMLLKEGMNPRAAAIATAGSVGQPILAGSVAVVAALAILSRTQNMPLAQLSLVAAFVVGGSLLLTLGLLPIIVTGRDTHGAGIGRPAAGDPAARATESSPHAPAGGDAVLHTTEQPTALPPRDELPAMPPVPPSEQATPWMQLKVRCPKCSLPLVFRVRGHHRAPGHLSCPRCRTRHKLAPDQIYHPVHVPVEPQQEAAFRCGHCQTEWRVGPVPANRVAGVRPGACPSCNREDKLARYRAPWP